MTKYRRKPEIVEARRFQPSIGCGDDLYIETGKGTMRVLPGDWIVTEMGGERYPMNPEVFEELFELV